MTITKKPSRTPPAPPARDAVAAAFIKAADQRVLDEKKTVAEKKPADEKKTPKVLKEKTHEKEPEKEHEKDKAKDKEKGKGKKKKAKKKEAVIIRFENAQLEGIDKAADALGLSRAAWVRMVVARTLASSEG